MNSARAKRRPKITAKSTLVDCAIGLHIADVVGMEDGGDHEGDWQRDQAELADTLLA